MAGPFRGHTQAICSVACSPDATHIVTGSLDKTIKIWNATTDQCVVGPFQGHTEWVNSIAFLPDGNHIVSGSDDGFIKVWRVDGLSLFNNWHEENGWIQSSDSLLFGWIAPWNRSNFHLPISHSLVISPDGTFQPDVDHSLFGESWISCWH